jgi:hypothetical protein
MGTGSTTAIETMVERRAQRGVCINEVTGPSGPISEQGLAWLLDAAGRVVPGTATAFLGPVRTALGAQSARLFVADYSLRRLQQVDQYGAVAVPYEMGGTIGGRAFATGEIIVSENQPTVVSIPLADGAERIGLLELDYENWNGQLPDGWERVISLFVFVLVTKSRYGDLWVRARRCLPLTAAAEIQWDLLPPLSCSTEEVGVGGILEPAYEIGGDSFDYAVNGSHLDFTIVDAIGRGMSAVLMSAAAINSVRSSRRSGLGLEAAYLRAGELIKTHFGNSYFVTGQLGWLDTITGVLTWVNAGHVLPMLVRDGSYIGELTCAPSMPLGLGGVVVEIATQTLQPGDRVLFYTDGITESRSPDGAFFGHERLADFLVRASLENLPVAETARRLSANVLEHVDSGLDDDASLLLIEYHGTTARHA